MCFSYGHLLLPALIAHIHPKKFHTIPKQRKALQAHTRLRHSLPTWKLRHHLFRRHNKDSSTQRSNQEKTYRTFRWVRLHIRCKYSQEICRKCVGLQKPFRHRHHTPFPRNIRWRTNPNAKHPKLWLFLVYIHNH